MIKIYQVEENWSTKIKIHHSNENASVWWKFIDKTGTLWWKLINVIKTNLCDESSSVLLKVAIHVRAGKCRFTAISYRLLFGCWYFDMLDRMSNPPIEIGFHIQ